MSINVVVLMELWHGNSMNVLQLISSSIGYYGAERVVVTLASALERLGVQCTVGIFRNTAKAVHLEVQDHARAVGLHTEQITCQGRFDRMAVHCLQDIIATNHIDVVHCHGIKPALYAWLATPHGTIPLLSTCHLWTFDSIASWALSAVERCILRSFDSVTAVSDHIIPQLRRYGINAQVIYNGIDTSPYASDQPVRAITLGPGPVIGAVGRLAPQKGLRNLIRVAPSILKRYPTATFAFVGDGPERRTLESLAEHLGIGRSVRFLGVRTDIPDLLAAMDVFAMPSISEGLPMSMLEAMASGRAVVASAVGAIPQVLDDGSNGLMVLPGDLKALSASLLYCLDRPEVRVKFGAAARRTVTERFSAVAMARQYIEAYEAIR